MTEPEHLLELSLRMGVDLTVDENLPQLLGATVDMARQCQQDLAKTERLLRQYEESVQEHDPVPIHLLDELELQGTQDAKEPHRRGADTDVD